MQTNPNRKTYIIAATLWLAVIGVAVVFFMLGGMRLFLGSYTTIYPKTIFANNSLYMTSPAEGWAVGSYSSSDNNDPNIQPCRAKHKPGPAAMLHYTDTKWVGQLIPVCTELNSVSMTSAAEGWAVGDPAAILHYQNGNWTQVVITDSAILSPDVSLDIVQMFSPNQGWVLGSISPFSNQLKNVLLRYDNNQWARIEVPTDTQVTLISMVSVDEGWAVGTAGGSSDQDIWHYQNGKWQKQVTVKGGNLRSLSMASAEAGAAVSYNNFIMQYKNGVWTRVNIPNPYAYQYLLGIHMLSPNIGWAVGDAIIGTPTVGRPMVVEGDIGVVLRYDGNSWTPVATLPDQSDWQAEGVFATSANEAWFTSSINAIWHYKEGNWQQQYKAGRY